VRREGVREAEPEEGELTAEGTPVLGRKSGRTTAPFPRDDDTSQLPPGDDA
jgi:hypothetical protein